MAKVKSGLVLCYDKTRDVLYLCLGRPQASIGEEVEDGVFLNRSPKSRKIVGITVLDFERRFTSTKRIKPLPMGMEISYQRETTPVTR